MHQFHRRRTDRDRFVHGHYVFSGQRHFASTIFADQILIVGWRLSKEAWSPVGSLSATRCTNASVFFLLFLFFLSRFLSLPSCILARWKSTIHRDVLESYLSVECNGVRAMRMLIASSYQKAVTIHVYRHWRVTLLYTLYLFLLHSKYVKCLEKGKDYKHFRTSE